GPTPNLPAGKWAGPSTPFRLSDISSYPLHRRNNLSEHRRALPLFGEGYFAMQSSLCQGKFDQSAIVEGRSYISVRESHTSLKRQQRSFAGASGLCGKKSGTLI